MNILETENLTKKFGKTSAVNNVSIHVKQGEIYGFLGLNGAGKTTTIRLLLGLIKPDSGKCTLFGKEPKQASGIWKDIGYLIETPHAYPDLTVYENLKVIQKLRGLKDPSCIDTIVDRLQLTRYRNTKEKNLSLGNKQRLGLAKALMHRPKLLILDEPINGLDPAGIVEVRQLLKDLAENHGTTVFLSSHILSEIAKLTTRIGIIQNGVLIEELHTTELRHKITRKLHVNCHDNHKAIEYLNNNGFHAEINEFHIEIRTPEAIEAPENISFLLVNHHLPPKMITVVEEDLEQYFLRVIKDKTP